MSGKYSETGPCGPLAAKRRTESSDSSGQSVAARVGLRRGIVIRLERKFVLIDDGLSAAFTLDQ